MAKKELKEKQKSEKSQPELSGAKKTPILTRGQIFQGTVIRKFPKRITIELERTVYVPKFERYTKRKTRIHARLPDELAHAVHEGDLVKVRECRPLSKIIHFMAIELVKKSQEKKE